MKDLPPALVAGLNDPDVTPEMLLQVADFSIRQLLLKYQGQAGFNQFALAHQRITESQFWFQAAQNVIEQANKPQIVAPPPGFDPHAS